MYFQLYSVRFHFFFVSVARPTFLVGLPGAFRQMVRKYTAIRRELHSIFSYYINANPFLLACFLPVARPTFLVGLPGAFRQMVRKYTATLRDCYSTFSFQSMLGLTRMIFFHYFNANPFLLACFLPVARPTFLVGLPGAFRQMVRKYTAIRREWSRPYRLIFEWAWRRKERALALETQQVCETYR